MKAQFLLVLALIFTIPFFVLSCNDNEDDNDSDDAESDDDALHQSENPECDEKHQPKLLGVQAVVNGEPVEMPVTIESSDTLSIAFEYADEDCDLDGGKATFTPNSNALNYTDLLDAVGTLYFPITGVGCSSEETGIPYNIDMSPADLVLPEGVERTLPWIFSISDDCEKVSDPNYMLLDITVVDADS